MAEGLVQEAPRMAPAGLSLTIYNLPKTMNDVKFARKVKELQIKFVKADKPFNKTAGRLRFENQEDRQAALAALKDVVVDGVTWSVRVPADLGGETGAEMYQRANRGRGGGASAGASTGEEGDEGQEATGDVGEDGEGAVAGAATVKEAIAPWHHFDYQHQNYKKYRAMRDILEKIAKRAKKDSVAALPEWLLPITKQKTKWLACPLDQVIPSPLTEGYRNKTELTIALDVHGKPAIGFSLGSMKNGVIAVGDPKEAPMFSQIHASLHELVAPFVANSGLPVWDKTTHTGFWRLLLLRSTTNEDSLIMFQVNPGALTPERYEKLKSDIVQHITTSDLPVKSKSTSPYSFDH